MEKTILFSIILPAYNEEKRLPDCIQKISAFIESHDDIPMEVLLIENGSKDRTFEMGCEYAEKYPWLKVIHEDIAGKGNAVRRGMLEAKGLYRMFADVDFSMPVEELIHFIPPAIPDYDVAIGSREVKGAVRYNEPKIRHFTGRVFNLIVRILAVPGVHDTQCGFKSFSAKSAQELFSVQRINGWAFDAEILYIAQKYGYKIVEVPVQWYYDGNSKINVAKDSIKMFRELLQIHQNDRAGLYERKTLNEG